MVKFLQLKEMLKRPLKIENLEELIKIAKSFLDYKRELWIEEMREKWIEEEFKRDFNKNLEDMDF